MPEKNESKAMTQAEPTDLVKTEYGIDVGRVVAMRSAVEQVIREVLRENEHFGIIPGTEKAAERTGKKPKKALLQPGAEVLCQVFRLRPQFEELALIEREDFISIKIKCKLYNSVTGELVGEAIGSANSREEKYVSQTTVRVCPQCGKPAIIKGKEEYGGGWLCYVKKDGCGSKFTDDDKRMIQDQGGVTNSTKVWGLYHTLESIAQKRAYVKATRNATATSDIFTDEDVPPDDDDHGQAGHGQGTKPSSGGPKAGVSDVTKLNAALNMLGIGGGVNPSLPQAEQNEQGKKVKLDWVNGMLDGRAKVTGMLELTPAQVADLIAKAERNEVPQGWE
jgi:hypothetical protein